MARSARVSRRRFLRLVAAPLVPSLTPRSASAQAYPARPVRVIVTSGPGGQISISNAWSTVSQPLKMFSRW
jgi:hypothetical protein